MAQISVGEFVVKFDDELAGLMSQFKWSVNDYSTSAKAKKYYAATSVAGRAVYMHRMILDADRRKDVDHINGDGLDNRRCNLRLATRSQNCANKPAMGGSSKYKGVCAANTKSPRYRAWVMKDKKSIYLGSFKTEAEAAAAYNKAAFEIWGEFAHLNEIAGN